MLIAKRAADVGHFNVFHMKVQEFRTCCLNLLDLCYLTEINIATCIRKIARVYLLYLGVILVVVCTSEFVFESVILLKI